MKVLLAGLGSIGQRHARNLRAVAGDNLDLLAYRVRRLKRVITSELSVETGLDVESRYNVKVYLDLDEALAQKPDAVFVTNPNSQHLPVALAAARTGCNLFIEKPLSQNFEGVSELINLVEKRGLVCLVGYQLRFHPGFKALRSLLEQKAIGRLLEARLTFGEYLPCWHKYEDYRQYHASRRDQGGGVILSQIHDLDYAYSLFGMPRRLFALGGKLSSLEIDVEDTVSILMECVVEGKPVPVHVHQDYIQRLPSRTCEVIGDAGKIMLDFHALTLQVFDRHGELAHNHTFNGLQRNHLFLDELKHFLACVRGEQRPMVTVRAGAQSLRVALAAKESLETGRVVELN